VEKEKDTPDSSGFDSESPTPPTLESPTIAFPGRSGGDAREAVDDLEPALPSLVPGQDRIGPYRLLQVLGEGGFGTVYLAEQSAPLQRQVAIKLLHLARRDRRLRRRFEVERQALARMSHPNVAVVYEAGFTHQGLPYIVMEYVPGVPITDYCDNHALSLRERLELFAVVCDGVQHAHQKAVLHRDLKPSNILVTESDGKPLPKIIDFGIAKALDRPAAQLTVDRGMVGTIAYLSPEAIEAGGRGADLDTRADVYTLGVLLYELLAGIRPFGRSSDREIMNRILTGDAARPSDALMAMGRKTRETRAAKRRIDVPGLRRALKDDLDAIVLKAIARERSARYTSAAELAADVRRHLAHEPVLAGPRGILYPAAKLIRRHRASAVAAVLVVLALVGGVVARTLEARRANAEAARANREAETARQVSAFLVSLFEASNIARSNRDTTARELLDRGAERIRTELKAQPLVRASVLRSLGFVYRSLGLYDKGEPLLRESVAIRRARLGSESLELEESLQDLGALLREEGHPKQALPVAEEALRIARRLKDPTLVGSDLMELAGVLSGLGRYAEAEPLLLEALAVREKAFGAESEKVSATLNNLGNLYYDLKRYPDSEKAQLRAIAIKEKTLGPDHPFVAQSFNNLANVYVAEKRLPEAEALHRRALAIKLKTLPPNHPEIGVTYFNLGDLAFEHRDLAKAGALYRQALDVWDKSLPATESFEGYALNGLANVERDLGHFAEAESLYRRALAIRKKNLPPGHPEIRETLDGYAALLRAAGRAKEAAALK
jgi:non-specific serine/threonine protein kinase/serine/threonine-protein kinase